MRPLAAFLAFSVLASAQIAHPRIWLDSANKTRLLGLVSSSDSNWIAMKAAADDLATYTVDAYSPTACSTRHICFQGISPYEPGGSYLGSSWVLAAEILGLAYQMTGSTVYSAQLKLLATSMTNAGVSPISNPTSGYTARNVALALGLIFDWIYPELTPTEISNMTALADINYNYASTKNFCWGTAPNAYGNFFGGYIDGLGVTALAMEGDDPNYATQMAYIKGVAWDNYVIPAFGTSGGMQGGYPAESHFYGDGHMDRIIAFGDAYRTAGKGSLGADNFAAAMARNLIREAQPDGWSYSVEGAQPGNRRVIWTYQPLRISNYTRSLPEGAWMKWMSQHLAAAPGGTPGEGLPNLFEKFFYSVPEVTAVDYTATQPLNFFSPGDKNLYCRTSWTDPSVSLKFVASTRNYTDHQTKSQGHIDLQRNGDFLLIPSGMWNLNSINHPLQYGINGTPSTDDEPASGRGNSLYYYDGGSSGGGRCNNLPSSTYDGCQTGLGYYNTVVHKETTAYAYAKSDMQSGYNTSNYPSWWTSFNAYDRSVIFANGITSVYDRINSTIPASTRILRWHFNSQATNTITGNVTKSSVGTSNLFVATVLPASPTFTLVDEPTVYGGATRITTRLDVNDSNGTADSRILTVLAPTASGVSTMPTTTSITATNFIGALYADTNPTAFFFTANGLPQAGISYTFTATGTVTHVVAGLSASTYTVTQGGTSIATPTVASDGSMSFASTSGGVFVVTATSGIAPTITTASLVDGIVGTPYSQTLAATGDPTITWSVSAGTLPTWATLNTSTGTISGTPTTIAISAFTAKATNTAGFDAQPLTLTIAAAVVVQPPSLGGIAVISGASSIK